MHVKVFTGLLCLGLLILIREGESAAFTAWTQPPINSATGSGTATTTLTEGMAAITSTGITLGVEGGPAHSYEITGQDPANTFTIANSGLITLAVGEVDYETKSSYVITVKVKDDADGSNTGIATVTILVDDKNEYTPSFGGDSFTVTKESAAVDDELLPSLAMDKDGSNTITYTFKSPTELFKFSSSNALQVAKALTANTKYELVIIATDGGTPALTSSATVTVCNGMAACKCSAGVPITVVGIMTMLAAIVASLI